MIKSLLAPAETPFKTGSWATAKETYPVGSVVTGTVEHLTDYGAFVSLSPGIQGMVHLQEMTMETDILPYDLFSVGQKLDVVILRVQPAQRKIRLGLKQITELWKSLETKYAAGQKIRGKVIRVMDHAVRVELEPGVAGMVTASEISWTHLKIRADDVFSLNQEVEVLVLGVNGQKRKVSLSIRQLKPNPWDQAETKYPAGIKVKGTVYKLTTQGAFVEIAEGICGLIRLSEVSWLRKPNHPSECLKIGGETEAVVLAMDQANRRLALSLKRLVPDPWETVDQRYRVGELATGNIVKLMNIGAIVELENGVQGLVHVSQISEQPEAKVKHYLKVGRSVRVRIMNIKREERRIRLSMLAASSGAETVGPSPSAPSSPAP